MAARLPKRKLASTSSRISTSPTSGSAGLGVDRFRAQSDSHHKVLGTLVYFCWQEKVPSSEFLKTLNGATNGAVRAVYSSGEFTGAPNTQVSFRRPTGYTADTVILVGVGERKKVNADLYRQGAGNMSRHSAVKKSTAVTFDGDGEINADIAQAVVEGFELGRWTMVDYKTDPKFREDATHQPRATIITTTARGQKTAQAGIARGHIVAHAVGLCRRLANQPSNVLTPAVFAEEAILIGRQWGFTTRVLDEKGIAKEKMGGVLGVAQGSANPPRFIIMEYKGASAKEQPVVLIGKGVTFDTGGISIKGAENMHEMKGDMTGGAVMITVMAAAAKLKLKLNLVGLVPTVENMPSSRAYKPGDILTMRKGKTVEVINTDAEGRLILADALDFANVFKPQAVIDIATLTGAALFVLGYSGAPILGTNRNLLNNIRSAADATAEKVWELPLWPEFTERLRSQVADLVNTAGRPAGTAVAACFLKEFIGDYPWAHIDIAYVDFEHSGKPYTPAGPSGFGVRLLVHLLSNWKKV